MLHIFDYGNMKDINSFIFEKLQLNKQSKVIAAWGDSIEEYCSDKDNLSVDDDYLEELDAKKYITKKASYWRANSEIGLYYVNSFKHGYEHGLELKINKGYDYVFFLINFKQFKLAFEIASDYDLYIYAIGPKEIHINSLVSGSRNLFKNPHGHLFLNKDDAENIKDVIDKVYNEINGIKKKIIDTFYVEYIDGPSPDKSPYKLEQKKRFPKYITHCIVTGKQNESVKKYTWNGEAEVFVQTVVKDGKNYYKVLIADRATGSDSEGIYYLLSLGQLDKFVTFNFKPHRYRKTSWIGGDGEIHYGSSQMGKSLPPEVKKDVITDKNLIASLKFRDMYLEKYYR